jgi:hypothetical protein
MSKHRIKQEIESLVKILKNLGQSSGMSQWTPWENGQIFQVRFCTIYIAENSVDMDIAPIFRHCSGETIWFNNVCLNIE